MSQTRLLFYNSTLISLCSSTLSYYWFLYLLCWSLLERSHKHLLRSVYPVCSHLVLVVSRVFVAWRSTSPSEGRSDSCSSWWWRFRCITHRGSRQILWARWLPPDSCPAVFRTLHLPLDYTGPPRGAHVMPESPVATIGPRRPSSTIILFALDVVTHADTMIQGGPLPNLVPAVPTR